MRYSTIAAGSLAFAGAGFAAPTPAVATTAPQDVQQQVRSLEAQVEQLIVDINNIEAANARATYDSTDAAFTALGNAVLGADNSCPPSTNKGVPSEKNVAVSFLLSAASSLNELNIKLDISDAQPSEAADNYCSAYASLKVTNSVIDNLPITDGAPTPRATQPDMAAVTETHRLAIGSLDALDAALSAQGAGTEAREIATNVQKAMTNFRDASALRNKAACPDHGVFDPNSMNIKGALLTVGEMRTTVDEALADVQAQNGEGWTDLCKIMELEQQVVGWVWES